MVRQKSKALMDDRETQLARVPFHLFRHINVHVVPQLAYMNGAKLEDSPYWEDIMEGDGATYELILNIQTSFMLECSQVVGTALQVKCFKSVQSGHTTIQAWLHDGPDQNLEKSSGALYAAPTRFRDLDYAVSRRPTSSGQVLLPCWGYFELGPILEDFAWIYQATRNHKRPAGVFDVIHLPTIGVCLRGIKYDPVTMHKMMRNALEKQWESEDPSPDFFGIFEGSRRHSSIRAFTNEKFEAQAASASRVSGSTDVVRYYVLQDLDRNVPGACPDCGHKCPYDKQWHMQRMQSCNAFEVHSPNSRAIVDMMDSWSHLLDVLIDSHLPCFDRQWSILRYKMDDLMHKVSSCAHRKAPGAASTTAQNLGSIFDRAIVLQNTFHDCFHVIRTFWCAMGQDLRSFEADVRPEIEEHLSKYQPELAEARQQLNELVAQLPGELDEEDLEKRKAMWLAQHIVDYETQTGSSVGDDEQMQHVLDATNNDDTADSGLRDIGTTSSNTWRKVI